MNTFDNMYRRTSMFQRAYVFLMAICLVIALSACGGSSTTTSTASTPSSSGASSAATTCNKSTGLTVYSAQGYDSDTTKAFQQQTGIATKLVDDSTGNLLAKIAAEGNNPQYSARHVPYPLVSACIWQWADGK